jgi:hypothetical protein
MATVDISDKSTNSEFTATEFNEILDAIKDGSVDINTALITATSGVINGQLQIADSAAENNVTITPTGDAGNSESTGGALLIDNSSNVGIGLNVYTNQDATADGNLVNFFATNVAFDQSVLRVKNDGVGKAINVSQTITSGGAGEAVAINSSDADNTTIGITGVPTGKGVVKITHNATGSDSAASALSIAIPQSTSEGKGIFINQDGTGSCEQVVHAYTANTDVKTVTKDGTSSSGFSERWLNGISRHGITLGNGSTTYRIWVDDSGNLRIHNTDPSAHNDGTVIGTQS